MNDEFGYDPDYYGKGKSHRHKEKPTVRERLKEVPHYLLYISKALSGLLPVAGEIVFYRELRNAENPVPKKCDALICLGLGAMKAPLFLYPCEETLAIYSISAWEELFGIALFSSGNEEDKRK